MYVPVLTGVELFLCPNLCYVEFEMSAVGKDQIRPPLLTATSESMSEVDYRAELLGNRHYSCFLCLNMVI